MADEGTQSATPAPNGAAPPAPPPSGGEWTSSLPADVRGHPSLGDVKDVGDLASRYVKLNKPFAEQLPERIRGEAAFKDIKNLEGLADSYYNAQKMIGIPRDQLLRIPTSDKPEDWAPVYDKLGRPAKPDDYKLKVPEGSPPAEKAYVESVTAAAHGAGLSQKQFETMTGWLYERAGQAIAQQKANADGETAAKVEKIRTNWGAATEQNLAKAETALAYYNDANKLGMDIEATKAELRSNPPMAMLFYALSKNLHEDGHITGKAFGADALKSPVEAQQQIAALRQDASFMKQYHNPNRRDPAHLEAVAKMEALHKLGWPGGQPT